MTIILIFKALLLGIVEGLTEFLPVSSTGHLILVGHFLHFEGEKEKVFEVVIQLGAILAVCWEFRQKINEVISGLFSSPKARRFAINLWVATLPAVVIGLKFHKLIKEKLFNPYTVALSLFMGGLVIFWVERKDQRPTVEDVDAMSWVDSLKVGCYQVISMIPGVSRSGATIIGGMLSGLSRQSATTFSFFLAIPTLLGAASLDLYKNVHLFDSNDFKLLVVGFISAFLSALFAVRLLIRYVAHHRLTIFAWYRVVLGFILLVICFL